MPNAAQGVEFTHGFSLALANTITMWLRKAAATILLMNSCTPFKNLHLPHRAGFWPLIAVDRAILPIFVLMLKKYLAPQQCAPRQGFGGITLVIGRGGCKPLMPAQLSTFAPEEYERRIPQINPRDRTDFPDTNLPHKKIRTIKRIYCKPRHSDAESSQT
jgi:hypothetical protein